MGFNSESSTAITLEILICTYVHQFAKTSYINMGLHMKIELFTYPFVRAKMEKSAYF